MELSVKDVTKNTPEIGAVRALYFDAFPESERAPFELLVKKATRPDVDFLAFFHGDLLVGMIYLLHAGDLNYLFYLAVPRELRGEGYGSEILQTLKKRYAGQSIFLSMEQLEPNAPNYEQRVRRRSFYQANGFQLLGRRVQEGENIFDLAGTDNRVTAKAYKKMMNSYMGFHRFFLKMRILDEN